MKEKKLLQAGYRYALSLAHDREEAEDLIQEAWYKIYRNKGKVNDKRLLFVAVRNLYIDQYRKTRDITVKEYDDELNHPESNAQIEADFSLEEIETALETLRSEESEILYLHAREGFSVREITEQTGMPRGTVLSLIHRSKKKIRKKLETLIRNRENKIIKFRAVK